MKIMIAMAGILAMAAQDAELPPDLWVHEGDRDGDGLSDAFEAAHGLDPAKADSFGDGRADEERLNSSGKTMWELQQAEQAAVPAAASRGGGGGGACGLTGAEGLLVLAFVAARRRRCRDSERSRSLGGSIRME